MAKKKKDDEDGDEIKDDFEGFALAMNKAIGRNIAYLPGKGDGSFDIMRFSSRVLAIDIAIGGGYPEQRNTYLFGPSSSGKSTLMLLAMAEITNREENNKVYLEDAENSFDTNWAMQLGVNMANVMIVRSSCAEEAFSHLRCAVASGKFAAVFLDSIAALQPRKLVEGTADDSSYGGIGRTTSVNMSNIEKDRFACYEKYGYMPAFFYTNQIRRKMGITFGSDVTEPGGEAPHYYASVRLNLATAESIVENELVVGGKHPFLVKKNKTFPSQKRGEFYLKNDGIVPGFISNEGTLLDMAVNAGVMEKAGAWYKYLGQNIAQGAAKAMAVLQEFPADKKNEMLASCMEFLHPNIKLTFRFRDDD